MMLSRDSSKAALLAALLPLLFSACGNGLDDLNTVIRQAGYIPYPTPLDKGGTGTVLGGLATRLQLIESPDYCFPKKDSTGKPTNLRFDDDSAIPVTSYSTQVSASLQAAFPNSISVGASFSSVKSVNVSMSGVMVEAINTAVLEDYYNSGEMSKTCKMLLDNVGFVVQALRVGKLSYQFVDQTGATIALNGANIANYVNISADTSFSVDQTSSLVITSPTYLGYQFGVLRVKDDGLAMYRATSVNKGGQYVFNSLINIPSTLPPDRR